MFTEYERFVREELKRWEQELTQEPGVLERLSRQFSREVNRHIPEKIHQAIAAGIRTMIESIRVGIQFTPKGDLKRGETLPVMDRLAEERVAKWTQWASAEGAGTGLGGFKLSLIDFPALLSIKMKMLSDLAYIYGFDPNEEQERLFLLSVFQLEYAEASRKKEILSKIKTWDGSSRYPALTDMNEIDWQQFQQDYRDSLDFKKLLQIVPGIGAVIGAWANYGLVKSLGKTAINAYRLRVLEGRILEEKRTLEDK
jgi:uncharacterized protein (DUF697 family)